MNTSDNAPKTWMVSKIFTKSAALLLVGAALFTGCVLTSIYPYYYSKDVISEPALLGKWISESQTNAATASEYWVFDKLDERTLKLTTVEGDRTNAYDVVVFKLGGAKFLDCLVRERHEVHTPGHILLRVEKIEAELEVSPLNYDWLEDHLSENPWAIQHLYVPSKAGEKSSYENLTLTAETSELQKFILKHLDTAKAWRGSIVMKR